MDGHVKGNVTGRPGEQTLLVVSDQGSITGNVNAYDIVFAADPGNITPYAWEMESYDGGPGL